MAEHVLTPTRDGTVLHSLQYDRDRVQQHLQHYGSYIPTSAVPYRIYNITLDITNVAYYSSSSNTTKTTLSPSYSAVNFFSLSAILISFSRVSVHYKGRTVFIREQQCSSVFKVSYEELPVHLTIRFAPSVVGCVRNVSGIKKRCLSS